MRNAGNRFVNNWIYPIADGYVLIDTGYKEGFTRFKKNLLKMGIDIEQIRYIFLTHAHDDHAGYLNDMFSKLPGLEVIMSEKAMEGLNRGQNSFVGGCTTKLALLFCNLMKHLGKGEHLFPKLNAKYKNRCIQVTDDNRENIESFLHGKVIDTPGHTSDSISLLLNEGVLFCGDAAMNGLPSLHRVTIWAENKELFLQSWKTIISLQPQRIYPGHGKPFHYSELKANLDFVSKMKLLPLKMS